MYDVKVATLLAADGLALAFKSMSTTASCLPSDDALWRGLQPSYMGTMNIT